MPAESFAGDNYRDRGVYICMEMYFWVSPVLCRHIRQKLNQ